MAQFKSNFSSGDAQFVSAFTAAWGDWSSIWSFTTESGGASSFIGIYYRTLMQGVS